MPVHVVFPKYRPANSGSAHLYLAGPIRNAPDYHEDAIEYLAQRSEEEGVYLRICCPKRHLELSRPLPESVIVPQFTQWEMHAPYTRQRPWEIEEMHAAAHAAGILFWLPKEGEVKFPGKAYGAMTQFELGEWKLRASLNPRLRIAIGSDGVYNNELRTIRYDFERDAIHVPWFNNLHELCEQGIQWAKQGFL